MHFDFSERAKDFQKRLTAFMEEHIYPNEQRLYDEIERERWLPTRVIEELKPKARAAGLWNLFLPDNEQGAGLSNLEYAPLCEIMGARWRPKYSNWIEPSKRMVAPAFRKTRFLLEPGPMCARCD